MNILITGAASGIGLEAGKRLSLYNHKIYLCVHTKSQCKRLINDLKEYKNIEIIKLDVTKNIDLKLLENLKIDTLFCNAGIGYTGSILDIPMKNVKRNYEINVFSTIKLIQIVSRQMIKRNSGRIIIMSSLLGEIPIKFFGIYSSTKSSLISIAVALRKELEYLKKNIKVSLIEPGAYYTGFNQIMIENKYEWMERSYFKKLRNKLIERELKMFSIIEKRNLSSIIYKIEDAILSTKPKFIYKAPFFQSLFFSIHKFIYFS